MPNSTAKSASLTKTRGRPRSVADKGATATVQALDRALSLMQALAVAPGQTLSDLAAGSGLPVATVFRALQTLQAHGMVAVEEPGQLWHIGPGAYRIGSVFQRRAGVVERARPAMEGLMRATGETAALGIAAEDQVLILSQVESTATIRANHAPGTTAPLHANAIGKAMLAWYADARLEDVLGRIILQGFTATTQTSVPALMRDLARVRLLGFALDDQEGADGLRAIAAPIFNAHGEPVAGLAVSGPASRLPLSEANRIGDQVMLAARLITEATGGRQP